MAQVLTEGVNLAAVVEATLGATTPPTSGWFNLQPNSIGAAGPLYKKLARNPISKNRQNQRPILIDEDSTAPWDGDVTKDLVDNFLEGIFMAATKHSGGVGVSKWTPSAFAATSITVPVNGASGGLQQYGLVYVRGTVSNNGLFQVGAASTTTSIVITGGVVETPPANATVEIAGWRASAAADIQMSGTGNITSTVADFTTMGLNVGQWIWVGGLAGGSNAFANAVYRGFARISAIAAHLLTLQRRSWVVGSADTATGKNIDLYFTKWIRNVSIDSADYKTPSYAFEITYPNLGAGPVAEYEYLYGNLVDQWVFNIPLTSKTTAQMLFTGTTSADPTVTRVTGPSAAPTPVTNLAVSTATDLMRLRISNTDETGISTDFTNIKITVKNNVAPEKQLGTLGATKMNVGKFEVMVDADLIFTSDDVIKAVHDNRVAVMDVAMRNGDFGLLLDVSSMSIDDTQRKFETNKSVVIVSKGTGFQDATLGFTMGGSVFAYLPPT
jgi:hypothetical protein